MKFEWKLYKILPWEVWLTYRQMDRYGVFTELLDAAKNLAEFCDRAWQGNCCYSNYINPGYGLSLVDTLWNASSYRQPLEQEGNPMT